MDYHILADEDVRRMFSMAAVIEIMEEAFRQQAAGNLSCPPRFAIGGSQGSLVFTVGESPAQGRGIGFRVYSDFKDDRGARAENKQLVAVFDSETGAFKGAVIGTAVGDMRTGAINGVAVKHLARPDATVLGMIGSGVQAVTQLEAAVSVRDFETILVYSRDPARREAFARKMSEKLGREILTVDSARAAVEPADVLMCSTTSPVPVFELGWVRPGAHINTIGPKLKGSHELPLAAAVQSDLVVTDTLAQIESMGERHFLHGVISLDGFVPMSDVVSGIHPGRRRADQLTVFCSNGLAGTEVALAAEALRKHTAG